MNKPLDLSRFEGHTLLKRELARNAEVIKALEKFIPTADIVGVGTEARAILAIAREEVPATPTPDKVERLKNLHERFLINVKREVLSEAEGARLAYAYCFGRASSMFIDSPESLELALAELWTAYHQALTEAGE